jgi:hypothetical protein
MNIVYNSFPPCFLCNVQVNGVLEKWSIGSLTITPILQHSNTPQFELMVH